MVRGPLAGRYPAVAAMVMFALIPYLALSAALDPLTPIIAKDLHTSLQTMSLSSGLGNAAYAVGTVLAVQFAQHLPQRRMMVIYAILLVIGSVLTASAQNAQMFIVGHVIQGLCTSLLLIAAVPPLAIGYPANNLRDTAVIMNMCIFGAVALGPFIGGLQAESNAWRPLFWIIAAISTVALILTLLTFDDAPPANPDAPRDPLAIVLAAVGCGAAFFGASELTSHAFSDPIVIVPLFGGLATIIALVIYQYRSKRPLLTVRPLLTSSIPVAGIVVALFAAAASVSATALTYGVLVGLYSPIHIGVLYLPEVGGRGGLSGGAWAGHPQARHALPAVRRHDLARGRYRCFSCRSPFQPIVDAHRLGFDRAGARRHRRTSALRRRFLATRWESSASVRDCRALQGGSRVHDRADFCLFRLNGERRSQCWNQRGVVGRTWARSRGRRHWCGHLCAQRCPTTNTEPRPLLGSDRPSLVFTTPVGENSFKGIRDNAGT